MSRRQGARLEGARETERALRRLPRQVQGRIEMNALRQGAKPIREAAQDRAPKDTGELEEEIIVRGRRRQGETVVRIGPSKKAFQGMLQEFGTEHHPAQPWLRPAFDEKVAEALDRIGEFLGRGIERAAKRLAGPIAKSGLLRRRRR